MNYDIVVAGGGPAGLSAAREAARLGARVAVFEKSREVGYPIHTSGGSWIDALRRMDVPERFMYPIYAGHFIAPTARAVFEYADPPSCILDVRGLYQHLAERASEAGAEIFVNCAVTGPRLDGARIAGVRVHRSGRTWDCRARVVIDATGGAAVLARKAGLSLGFRRYGVGAEYDLYAPQWPEHTVAFLFGRQVAPSGYGWVFPHGSGRVRLGVGLIHPDTGEDPKLYVERLLSRADLFGGRRVSRLEYHTGIIPSEAPLARMVTDGLLVVGDAGGLISTLLGEGIRFALDLGRMAGEVAGSAVARGRSDAATLQAFETRWQRKYLRVFRLGLLLNVRLAQYTDAQWDRRIRELARIRAEFVPMILKGDFTVRSLLRFVRAHPGFLGRTGAATLKTMLKSS